MITIVPVLVGTFAVWYSDSSPKFRVSVVSQGRGSIYLPKYLVMLYTFNVDRNPQIPYDTPLDFLMEAILMVRFQTIPRK
jgi:hypothetical protein